MPRTEQGIANHRAAKKRYKQSAKYREYHVGYMKDYYTRTRRGVPSKGSNLKTLHGITLEDYEQMLAKQKGKCGCCGRHSSEFKRLLCVDHDHETNQIRGLLCGTCNTGIGKLGDSVAGLKRAIEYLEKAYASRQKRYRPDQVLRRLS